MASFGRISVERGATATLLFNFSFDDGTARNVSAFTGTFRVEDSAGAPLVSTPLVAGAETYQKAAALSAVHTGTPAAGLYYAVLSLTDGVDVIKQHGTLAIEGR